MISANSESLCHSTSPSIEGLAEFKGNLHNLSVSCGEENESVTGSSKISGGISIGMPIVGGNNVNNGTAFQHIQHSPLPTHLQAHLHLLPPHHQLVLQQQYQQHLQQQQRQQQQLLQKSAQEDNQLPTSTNILLPAQKRERERELKRDEDEKDSRRSLTETAQDREVITASADLDSPSTTDNGVDVDNIDDDLLSTNGHSGGHGHDLSDLERPRKVRR